MTDPSRMNVSALVEARSMRALALALFVAVMVRLAVLVAFERPDALGEAAGRVDRGVFHIRSRDTRLLYFRHLMVGTPMRECQSCKVEREKEGKPPRPLHELPRDVTNDKQNFKKIDPIFVCLHCDGETLYESAVATHEARSK